jgi:predicted GIY-YIG superfamily endonuclease
MNDHVERSAPNTDYFVYILRCRDGTHYVGHTNDLSRRFRQHRRGTGAKHTAEHSVAALVWREGPVDLTDAVRRERQLKRWSRLKKEALIRGDASTLRALSRSRNHGQNSVES